jgi:hypothetical protein
MYRRLLAVILAGFFFGSVALAQQPNYGQTIGPGSSSALSTNATIWPFGLAAVSFATLPTCTAALLGSRANISTGSATPVWGAVQVGGGSTYYPVLCAQTGVSTFNWIND